MIPGDRRLLTLTLHGVGKPHSGVGPEEDFYWCDRDTFERLADGAAKASGGDGPAIRITVDDGNLSDLSVVAPALADRGLVGLFFPCTGRFGDSSYLGGAELRELRAMGMEIGCHGHDHLRLTETDDEGLEAETTGARHLLEAALGETVREYAFAYGAYDDRAMRKVADFDHIHTTGARIGRGSDQIVHRHVYARDWDAAKLDRLLAVVAN